MGTPSIKLDKKDLEHLLESFFQKGNQVFADRLHEIGDILYSSVPSPFFSRYLEAVICYSLGFYDACIASACLAAESYLRFRMIGTITYQHHNRVGLVGDELSEQEKDELNYLGQKATYGNLIERIRTHERFSGFVTELEDHESMNDIRTAYFHWNPEKLKMLHAAEIRSAMQNHPPWDWRLIEGIVLGLRTYWPREKALEALKIANRVLAPVCVDSLVIARSPSEKFMEALEQFHSVYP
jgi:hypothetical protein